MNTYKAMLIARRVRIILLAAFLIFVAWNQMWWLVLIGLILMTLTLWQTKRLKEEVAAQLAEP